MVERNRSLEPKNFTRLVRQADGQSHAGIGPPVENNFKLPAGDTLQLINYLGDRYRNSRTNIDDVGAFRLPCRRRDDRPSRIVHIDKVPLLRSIPCDRHRLGPKNAICEQTDHAAVRRGRQLTGTIDVKHAEADRCQARSFGGECRSTFQRHFLHPMRIDRIARGRLGNWAVSGFTVDSRRRSIDHRNASGGSCIKKGIRGIFENFQMVRTVCSWAVEHRRPRQMDAPINPVKCRNKDRSVADGPIDQFNGTRHPRNLSIGEIVEYANAMPCRHEPLDNFTANEPTSTAYQEIRQSPSRSKFRGGQKVGRVLVHEWKRRNPPVPSAMGGFTVGEFE